MELTKRTMHKYEQQELDLGISSDNQQSPQPASQSRHEILREAQAELRQKARLYATGGGIHFGIPPEERSSTKYWNK
jgi:hypothetical protein